MAGFGPEQVRRPPWVGAAILLQRRGGRILRLRIVSLA